MVNLKKKRKNENFEVNNKKAKEKFIEDEEILSDEADSVHENENGDGIQDGEYNHSKRDVYSLVIMPMETIFSKKVLLPQQFTILETADEKRIRLAKQMINKAKDIKRDIEIQDDFFADNGV